LKNLITASLVPPISSKMSVSCPSRCENVFLINLCVSDVYLIFNFLREFEFPIREKQKKHFSKIIKISLFIVFKHLLFLFSISYINFFSSSSSKISPACKQIYLENFIPASFISNTLLKLFCLLIRICLGSIPP